MVEAASASVLVSSPEEARHVQQQDDFFYKIICLSPREYKIEVKTTRRSYNVRMDPSSATGFTGLPFEWERYFEKLEITKEQVEKYPYDVLLSLNFAATSGFSIMENN